MSDLTFKLADSPAEFEAIHRLNYRTFVEEIPQHAVNAEGRLVDRFHAENTYVVALAGGELVGMLAGRCARPFSLDGKVPDLDRHLPAHRRAVEVRLLAVEPAWRARREVFARLVGTLSAHFRSQGCDLALISGTTRQLRLYDQLGFRPFGHEVGTPGARYQPMALRLHDYAQRAAHLELRRKPAALLPGPVTLRTEVLAAHAAAPVSHRSPLHLSRVARIESALCRLTGARGAVLLPGGGTLANEAVAAQLLARGGSGVVISAGEFGERLADQARRWRLPHRHIALAWGEAPEAVLSEALAAKPAWLWTPLCETSTGARAPLDALRSACAASGTALCLDAVSALGLAPVDLRGVALASGVSGKALGAPAGMALVLHDGSLQGAGSLPRALDLAEIAATEGVGSTQPGAVVAALDVALARDWQARFAAIAAADVALRAGLAAQGLAPLLSGRRAQPGLLTLPVPGSSARLGARLERRGLQLHWRSAYLRERAWVQIALMGEWAPSVVEILPGLLKRQLVGARD